MRDRDRLSALESAVRRAPQFAAGSYVVVQKYLHDLAAWDALPVEEQERAIGRTKLSGNGKRPRGHR